MENPEEVLQTLDEFTKLKPKDIPKELEDYLSYVAKTGDPVYQWSLVKALFREKLLNVITDFYESCPSVDLPPCPNVDTFNYETMKDRLIERLDLFASAPFTVQRLCELLTSPKKQYSRADKFMRAVEKNIMVVSTREPGPVRRSDNTQAELVNGVTENITLDNECSRVNLSLSENVDSSTTTATPFINTEGSVQVIFEDSSLEKTHSPTKPYEESYEDGVPRRGASWFRERVESPDKLSAFGPQIHNQVNSHISEDGDVEVGNQLGEKYGSVTDQSVVEEDEDDIDDEYTRNVGVTHFHSQETGPTLLGLESSEEYCCPSPDEENSETSVAVSTITEEISNPITDSHIHENGLSPTVAAVPVENSKDVPITGEGESSTCDIQNDKIENVASSIEITNTDEKQDSVSVELIDETTIPIPAACTETSADSENDKLAYTEQVPIPIITEELDNGSAESMSSDTPAVEVSSSKDETDSIDSNEPSKDENPEPTVIEPLESETSDNNSTKECQGVSVESESTVTVVDCTSLKDNETIEAETIEMSILESLGPITTEETSDDNEVEPEVSTLKDVPTPELLSEESADFALEESRKKTDNQIMVETVSELPVDTLEPLTTSSSLDVTQNTTESVTSVEEERDREMLIQNERVESVIQENVEQTPLQEEILMQQIFVPNEIPMDEKTLECEPEAMDVDETSQTVEEPMEQGDISPTIS